MGGRFSISMSVTVLVLFVVVGPESLTDGLRPSIQAPKSRMICPNNSARDCCCVVLGARATADDLACSVVSVVSAVAAVGRTAFAITPPGSVACFVLCGARVVSSTPRRLVADGLTSAFSVSGRLPRSPPRLEFDASFDSLLCVVSLLVKPSGDGSNSIESRSVFSDGGDSGVIGR